VKLWDMERSHPVVFRGHFSWVSGVAFSHDGRRVVSEHDNARILAHGGDRTGDDETKFWDAATGRVEETVPRVLAEPSPEFERGGKVGDLSVKSPDGRRLVRPGTSGLEVVDESTGRVFNLVGALVCASFSPDGRRISTAGWDDFAIRIWDAEDGRELLVLRGHTAGVLCCAFSPDGHRLVSGSIDGTARLWDATPLERGRLSAVSSSR
jgi:WD40 repeat protein